MPNQVAAITPNTPFPSRLSLPNHWRLQHQVHSHHKVTPNTHCESEQLDTAGQLQPSHFIARLNPLALNPGTTKGGIPSAATTQPDDVPSVAASASALHRGLCRRHAARWQALPQ